MRALRLSRVSGLLALLLAGLCVSCGSALRVLVSTVRDAPASSSLCNVTSAGQSSSSECSLRSAVALCAEVMSSESPLCEVELPVHEEIAVNATLGVIAAVIKEGELVLRGGGSVVRLDTSSATLEESSVGLLQLQGSEDHEVVLRVSNVSFVGFTETVLNVNYMTVHVEDSMFLGNTAEEGASLYLYESVGSSITRCSFQNNRATNENGGALYLYENVHGLTISDSLFVENVAVGKGGSVYLYEYNDNLTISDSNFTSNIAMNEGGGIYMKEYNDYCLLKGCNFMNNSALAGDGGALNIHEKCNYFSLYSSTFQENRAPNGSGGAVCFDIIFLTVRLDMLVFQDNYAGRDGGACIFSTELKDVYISNSEFTRNIAGGSGGGIFVFIDNHDILVSDCTFDDNIAYSGRSSTKSVALGGGALFFDVKNSNVVVSDCSMRNNSAPFASGGSSFVNGNNRNVQFLRCNETNNFAFRGGGSLYVGSGNSNVLVQNGVMENNTAQLIGGGACMMLAHNEISFINSTFGGNSARVGGGLLCFLNNFYVKVQDCKLMSNTASLRGGAIHVGILHQTAIIERTQFIDNWAQEGGAVSVEEWSVVTVTSSYFYANIANPLNSAGSSASTISEAFGGAIFSTSDDVHINETSFERNEADSGGALHMSGNNIRIYHAIFSNNVARVSGGALHLVTCNDVVISNCSMVGNQNTAVELQFAVEVTVSYTNIIDSIGTNGAALSADSSEDVIVSHSHFENNVASGDGGALHFFDTSDAEVINVTFIGNMAEGGGALYIADCLNFQQHSSLLLNNNASVDGGGGISLKSSSTSSITGNTFENNTSTGGGGAVYWQYDGGTMSEPTNLLSNQFVNNLALYGDDVATDAVHLEFSKQMNLTSAGEEAARGDISAMDDVFTVVEMTTYDQDMTWLVNLVDMYDQSVASQSGVVIAAVWSGAANSACGEEDPYITGQTMAPIENGEASLTFNSHCNPNGFSRISFSADLNAVPDLNLELKFRNCFRGEYFTDGACVQCPNGTYSLEEHGNGTTTATSCTTCPSHATCYGDVIMVEEGYWRLSDDVVKIFSCPVEGSCVGGANTGTELCGQGYTGVLCGVCEANYYFPSMSNQCEVCSNDDIQIGLIVVLVLSFLLCLVVLVYCCGGRVFRELLRQTGLSYLTEKWRRSNPDFIAEKQQFLRSENTARKYQNKLKQLITFFQIITAFPSILSTTFPTIYHQLTSIFNVINMGGILQDLGLVCNFNELDYVSVLVGATIIPIALSLVFYLIHVAHCSFVWHQYSPAFREIANTESRIIVLKSTYFYVFLFFTYLILPGVSTVLFGMLKPCTNVDPDDVENGDQSYLDADLSINCEGGRYEFGVTWAVVFCFVYPLGIPCYYFYLLYNAKKTILKRSKIEVNSLNQKKLQELEDIGMKISSIKFLFQEYQPKFWYFEIIETYRKLFLTSVLSVISPGSTKQLACGNLFVVFCLIFYVCMDPFDDLELTVTSAICQIQIWYILFVGILIKENVHISSTFIEVSLAIAILFIFVYEAFICIIEFCPLPKRVERFFNRIIVSKSNPPRSAKKIKRVTSKDYDEESIDDVVEMLIKKINKEANAVEGSVETKSDIRKIRAKSISIDQSIALVEDLQTTIANYKTVVSNESSLFEEVSDDEMFDLETLPVVEKSFLMQRVTYYDHHGDDRSVSEVSEIEEQKQVDVFEEVSCDESSEGVEMQQLDVEV